MDDIIKQITHEIYKQLGKNMSEIIYERAFSVELQQFDIKHSTEVILNINYKGINVGYCRQDIVLYHNNKYILIELKAINKLSSKERDQIKKYLTHNPQADQGYLINFGSREVAEIFKFEKKTNQEINYKKL
jgi:GxxExxY protein